MNDNFYYWDKDINLPLEKYIYNDLYVFPEHMFFINSINDINYLIDISKNKYKNIIAGVGWYELINEKLIEKNGVIIIDCLGNFNIYEKYHYLRFCETNNQMYYISNNKKRCNSVFICSEFFLMSIKKISEKDIIIASINWKNTTITFFYKNIMKRIYDLMLN